MVRCSTRRSVIRKELRLSIRSLLVLVGDMRYFAWVLGLNGAKLFVIGVSRLSDTIGHEDQQVAWVSE